MPSNVVASANYDVETSTLRITFVSGLIYDYKQVPKEIYEAMMKSGSKGVYLNNNIKGKYDFQKILSSNPF